MAHASLSQVQDGFEVNPQGSWLVATGGSASAGFDVGAGTARSGRNNGWLFATNGRGHLLHSTYPWLDGSGAYQAVNTARWNLNGVNPVFVRAIIGANGSSRFVRLDDMTTQCSW